MPIPLLRLEQLQAMLEVISNLKPEAMLDRDHVRSCSTGSDIVLSDRSFPNVPCRAISLKSTKITQHGNQPAPVLSVVPTAQTRKKSRTHSTRRGDCRSDREFQKAARRWKPRLSSIAAAQRSRCRDRSTSRARSRKHKALKARDDALAAKIKTAEELRPIIEELIEELKRSQPEALKAVLRRKLEQLEKEAAAEQEQAALLKEQIDSLKALLEEIEKPAAAAKRKKE